MNPIQGLTEYFRSAKAELEKVSWPSRKDTVRYSALVIAISVILAGFFASLDLGLNRGVDFLLQSRTAAPAAPPADQTAPIGIPQVQATTPNGQPVNVNVTPLPTPSPTPSPTKK